MALPPTTSKVSGDASNITTFNYQFPNFTGTHTGTTVALGVNGVAGGGTGQSSYTDGQLLIGNSSGNTLTKASLTAGSNITITPGNGSISIAAASATPAAYNVTSQATTYSASINDYIIASGASFTVTLPTAVGQSGKPIIIQHNGTSLTQAYTLNTTSAQTIGGIASGSYVLQTNSETLTLISDGSNWQILEHKTTTAWAAWTPTFVGCGTVTAINTYWRRQGPDIEIIGQFEPGTTGGSTASMSLPGTITAASILPIVVTSVLYNVGYTVVNATNAQAKQMLISSGSNVVNFSLVNTVQNGLQTQVGSTVFNNTSPVSFMKSSIPITGWQP